MTDRDKLLELYNKLKNIEIPRFESESIQIIANTIKSGIDIMLKWLIDTAREHFGRKQ